MWTCHDADNQRDLNDDVDDNADKRSIHRRSPHLSQQVRHAVLHEVGSGDSLSDLSVTHACAVCGCQQVRGQAMQDDAEDDCPHHYGNDRIVAR